MTDTGRNDDAEPTIECTLTEAGRERREHWVRAELLPHYERIEDREDGYEVVFSGADDTLTTVAEAVRRESQCCSFADFEIAVESPYEETRLRVSAPEEGERLMREGFVEAFEEASPPS